MQGVAKVVSETGFIEVALEATELVDSRFGITLNCDPEVSLLDGEVLQAETVRLICGSGMTYARRILKKEHGLRVVVNAVCGKVERTNQTGLALAVTIAIARSFGMENAIAGIAQDGWSSAD